MKKDDQIWLGAEIGCFLEDLFGKIPEGFLTLSSGKDKWTKAFPAAELGEAAATAAELSAVGDTFYGLGLQRKDPGPGKRCKAEDVFAIPCFWFDLGIAGRNRPHSDYPGSYEVAIEFVKTMPLRPSWIIHTGEGLNLFWRLGEPMVFHKKKEWARAQNIMKGWQRFIIRRGKDLKWRLDFTGDLAHRFHIPYTLNFKTNPPLPVEVTVFDRDLLYSLEDFEQARKKLHCLFWPVQIARFRNQVRPPVEN